MAKKEQTLEQVQKRIATLEAARNDLLPKYQAIQGKVEANYKALKMASKQAANMRFAEQLASGKFDFAMLLEFDHMESNYEIKDKAFRQLWPKGEVRAEGYLPDTMQYMVCLHLDEKTADRIPEIAKFLTEQIVPVIKPASEGYGKLIDFMEPSLSIDGIHRLSVFEDRVEHRRTRYGRMQVIATFKNLLEALQYLQKNYSFREYSTSEEEPWPDD